MLLAVLQTRGTILDLVQVLSQMLMRWVTASMTTLSQRLNGLASLIPADLHEGELDTENEDRKINRLLGLRQYGTYYIASSRNDGEGQRSTIGFLQKMSKH
jgi:hypothetical protein